MRTAAGDLHLQLILNVDTFSDWVRLLFLEQIFYLVFDNFRVVDMSVDCL